MYSRYKPDQGQAMLGAGGGRCLKDTKSQILAQQSDRVSLAQAMGEGPLCAWAAGAIKRLR
jgi:hypothetical protein